MEVMNTKLPTILHVDDDDNDHIFFNLAHQQTKIPANIVEVSDGEQAIDYLDRKGDYADRVGILLIKLGPKRADRVVRQIGVRYHYERGAEVRDDQ